LIDQMIHLSAGGVSLVVDIAGPRLPRIVYWGRALGQQSADDLTMLLRASIPPAVSNTIDHPQPIGVVAEAATGWLGTPGIEGHHDGADFSPLFVVETATVTGEPGNEGSIDIVAVDQDLAVKLTIELALAASGLVTVRATVTNEGSRPYVLDSLLLNLPVPLSATEILDFSGRHLRERSPQRHEFTVGTHQRTGRRGRTGADATLLLSAGTSGFGFERGDVWGVHTAWSGNHTTFAERTNQGVSILGGGEQLLPGEIRLARGERYQTPTLFGSYGSGLNELSDRFHRYLRARPEHPRSPRLVALNTWEAVYFAHDLHKLVELAERAAEIGVERFILDDGWFRNRRNDRAGLGDWYVDESVWPDGLGPLVSRVRELGMQFGLWFEPEMLNMDSDAVRAHPDWVMSTGLRTPPESRHQQVLDLANPEAYAYILERIDALTTEYSIDYIKWDHNRDLVDAGHPESRKAAIHDQTLALYRLIDELRRRHPALEIESCSSGGARADLGILQRTERIWASDSLDALERQNIQRWTGLIVPPEMMGSHVGAPTSHTSGRNHTLGFRAGTAFFGHFGVEWNVTKAAADDLADLHKWIDSYKELRPLLHSGTVIRVDTDDPEHWIHGVVAADRSEAIFAFVALGTGLWAPPGRMRLPGLEPDASYEVSLFSPADRERRRGRSSMPAWSTEKLRLTGRVLAVVGIQAPYLPPEQLQLFRVRKVSGS
jgi:alpha-galactosidase